MTSNKNNTRKQIIYFTIALATGLLLGWLIFGGTPPTEGEAAHQHDEAETKDVTWTCSMHPQVRQDEPGQCPICAMDLVPVASIQTDVGAISVDNIQMTEAAVQLANVQTTVVDSGTPPVKVNLFGKIEPDETNISEITARFGGRIEKLFVNYTGQEVQRGDKLATIYSPELVSAQKELLEAARYSETNPGLFGAAKEKLRLWDIESWQIEKILEQGEPIVYFNIRSPITGTVTQRRVAEGEYVQEGRELFRVIDLTHVWAVMDAYERDLPWISTGDTVDFTAGAIPGEQFSGTVSFVDPVIDTKTRVAGVRIAINNPEGKFRPGMFVNGTLHSQIAGLMERLLVPASSVLWTGKRSVVYVKVPGTDMPTFSYREVTLGPKAGDYFVIADGLETGEEIATNGVFKIDAAAQLAGKQSMMNPGGGAGATGHQHGSMQMTGDQQMMQALPELPEDFREEFQPVLGAYFDMKDALVQSDLKTAQEEAAEVMESLDEVMAWAEGQGIGNALLEVLSHLSEQTKKLHEAQNIDQARKQFIMLSDMMIGLSKQAGPFPIPVYVQFCPMANENQGAYWLSTKEQIRNPYYGDMMLTCGEVRDVIK